MCSKSDLTERIDLRLRTGTLKRIEVVQSILEAEAREMFPSTKLSRADAVRMLLNQALEQYEVRTLKKVLRKLSSQS